MIQSNVQTIFSHLKKYMSKLFPVCPVFTSSGPVRTIAVFPSVLPLSTAHSSVCLPLKKLTIGSGDWSICLQGQTHKDQWDGECVCVCVCMCIFIIANLSSCHSSNLVSESRSLQEYPIFTAVSTRTEKEWAGKSEKATVRRCCHVATAQHLKWSHYPATVFHNTFFVPSQNPYFKPSLLKQSYSLGDSLLKSVLYCGHS